MHHAGISKLQPQSLS